MIVLHDQRIIFLKSRKTAGSSLEIALSAFAKDHDIIAPIDAGAGDDNRRAALGYPGPQNYQKQWLELLTQPSYRDWRDLLKGKPLLKYHNHCAARRARRHLGKRIWDTYEKISVVRNPWDYMVSSYYWGTRNHPDRPEFEQWCLDNQRLITRNRRQYFIGNTCVVDRFLRYEQLDEGLRELEHDYPALAGLADKMASLSAKKGVRPESGPTVQQLFEQAPAAERLIRDKSDFEIRTFRYQSPCSGGGAEKLK